MAALHIPRDNCAVNFALTCEDIRKMSDRLDYLIRAFQTLFTMKDPGFYSFTALVYQ